MSIVTPDGILNVENATLRVPSIEVQGVNVTTALSTLSNVGIGTASPDERLHVHGPDAGFILQSNLNSATMEIGGPGGAVMDLKGAFTDDYDLRIKTTGTGGVISSVGEANHLVFGAASGYTGFGVASPQFKIDAQGSAGVDAVSNPITHNSVILYDDQESTTTFSGTSGGSSSGRDTTNKYYELNSLTQSTVGYIHWPMQLPNSFTAEFERYSGGGTGGNDLLFSFFNTSAPTTDGNHGGYKVYVSEKYGGGGQKVAIKYRNAELINKTISIANASWQKVVVSYDRGSISVSFNGKLVVSYEHTQNADAYTGAYIGFLATTDSLTNYHRIRNVKITSGAAKWIYTNSATSNAASLAYLSGNVGIGTQTPTELLEVSGNVKVSSGYHLMGDGGLISNIATTLQSISDQGNTVSNTIQFTNTTTGLTSTGNVEVTNNKFFKGDGGLISNIATTLGDIVDQGNATSNTMVFANANVALNASGNIEVVNSKFFKGDGGLISNIATTLQAITDQGNVASNTLQFTNTDVAFITTANVGIANSAPTVSLSVGSNLHVDEYGSNVLDIVGNVSMSNLTLSGFGIEASYGLQHVTAENATTAETITLTHASKALDITSNVEMGGTLKFDSNAAITSVTGDVINQGFMEQPTQGLTNYRTYIEGHGTYEASASSYDSGNSLFPWEAFDNDTITRWAIGSEIGYNTTSGEWNATSITNFPTINTIDVAGTRHSGHWLQIKLPYQIVLSHSNVFPTSGLEYRAPKDGVILGSNDGEDWYELQRFTGKTYTSGQWTQIDVNAEASYQYFRLCITKIGTGGSQQGYTELTEWRLFAKDRITKLADNILLNGSIASDTLNTGYVKWPKVPLLADSYNGYEVSASSEYDTTYVAQRAFNGLLGDSGLEGWTSGSTTFDATTGAAHSSNAALFDGVRCEWIQLKLPRNKKIKLSHFVIAPRTNSGSSVSPEDAPKEGAMYGSNDGTTWTKLITYSGLTYGGATGDQSEKVVVRSDTKYQYFRLTVTKRNIATATGTFIDIAELGLFERSLGVAQNPDKATLQVGGSLGLAKGSEIFAGDDIVMELDGPHDRPLTKYPEIDLLSNDDGNGYVASGSSRYSAAYEYYEAFDQKTNASDDNTSNTGLYGAWISTNNTFDTNGDPTSTSNTFPGTSYRGEYCSIQMPTRIKLKEFQIYPRGAATYAGSGKPKDMRVFGTNDGGITWTHIKQYQDLSFTGTDRAGIRLHVDSDELFNTFAFFVEKTIASTVVYCAIGRLELYGYEEGDVSTDLVWSPVYNKPGTQHLDVYWDANDRSSYMGTGTTVNDLSGNGVTGTLTGVEFDTVYNSFYFDTTNDDRITATTSASGAYAHSVSMWVKFGELDSSQHYISHLGTKGSALTFAGMYYSDNYGIRVVVGNEYRTSYHPPINEWIHVTYTYSGGTPDGTAGDRIVKFYVNGERVYFTGYYQRATGALALPSSSVFQVTGSSDSSGAANNHYESWVGNARLFSKALQATQVKELYDWQKDFFFGTKSTMTLTKGNLGLGASSPTDRLEVVGRVKADSSKIPTGVDRNNTVIRSETGPHDRPLVKYPEIKMTANSSGGYVASASSQYAGGLYDIWKAYDGERTHAGSPSYYYSSSHAVYSTTNGAYAPGSNPSYSTTSSGTAYAGEYVQMQFPTPIKLSYVRIVSPDGGGTYNKNSPKQGVICGSNDGTTWTTISAYSGITYHTLGASADIQASSNVAYKYIRLVATHIEGVGSTGWFVIEELEYYGYEEGDVSTDLTWSSVYNKPGTQHLDVYWDANDSNSYAGSGTTVTDLSGNGVTGTLTTNVTFDTVHNAWEAISTAVSGMTGSLAVSGGDWAHTFAYWVKVRALPASGVDYLFGFATAVQYGSLSHYINTSGQLVTGSWTLDYPTSDFTIPVGEWFHVATTYSGGGFSPNVNAKTYINGELKSMGANISVGTDGSALVVPTTAQVIYVGYGYAGATTSPDASYGNFRMFSKALSVEQVKELYDWQKDHFLGDRSSMTLYKGNLGLGVAEPSSRFEVAGNARIQEYPPKAMTGFDTYMEGHGVFRASQSIPYPLANYTAWKVFDKSLAYGAHFLDSYSSTADYIYDGAGTRSDGLGGIAGDWVMLEMPYAINLKSFAIAPASIARAPEDFVILGSNDGTLWTQLINYTGLGSSDWPYSGGQYILKHFDVPSTKHYYKYFAIVVTRTESNDYLQIDAMVYYGTPAPSGLEDGHLTLGKALTLPRVSGHPAGAETPRAESLIVHYDTTVDSVVSGSTAVDSSGSGNHGTLVGAVYSSLDRALTFDGTNDYIEGTLNNPAGAWVHTVSCWYKADTPDNGVVWAIGSNSTNKQIAVNNVNGDLYYHIYGCNSTPQVAVNLSDGVWHHLVAVFKNSETTATNGVITGRTFYMDGVEVPLVASNNQVALNLNANSTLRLANQYNAEYQQGFISNFKIWSDVALTAGEVAMEYALGRTGKAINVTDTAVCIGGTTPTAQLDVRGSIVAAGSIQFTNPRFFAHSYNGTTSFSGGDTLVYNLTEYNIGSCYSTSTGYFTAPVNGVYHFTVAIYSFTALEYAWKMIQTAGSISMNNMHVSRNNSGGDDLLLTSIDSNRVISSSLMVYLRIGEQFGWGSRSGSGSFYKAHGHFSGHLISRV